VVQLPPAVPINSTTYLDIADCVLPKHGDREAYGKPRRLASDSYSLVSAGVPNPPPFRMPSRLRESPEGCVRRDRPGNGRRRGHRQRGFFRVPPGR
jgi:hypothetical protein